MFRVSSHPSSGVPKTVTTASGTGHIVGAVPVAVVTVYVLLMMGATTHETCMLTLQ